MAAWLIVLMVILVPVAGAGIAYYYLYNRNQLPPWLPGAPGSGDPSGLAGPGAPESGPPHPS